MNRIPKLKALRFLLLPAILIAALFWINVPPASKGFDSEAFSEARVMDHIRYLSSPECAGRMTGTPGNDRAVAYVKDQLAASGVAPVPGNGYEQRFKTLVPKYGQDSWFRYTGKSGEQLSFKLYKDYSMYASGMGGSIDYSGDLIFVDTRLYDIPVDMLKDRVVIMTSATLNAEAVTYAQQHGAKGLFSYIYNFGVDTDALVKMKRVSVAGKEGPVLGLGVISRTMFNSLRIEAMAHPIQMTGGSRGAVVGVVPQAEIRQAISFEGVAASNVIGMIPGTKADETLLIGGHLDHIGEAPEGGYFPGALDNASGTAMMLELARLCAGQDTPPEKTLIFAAWNAEENGLNGSEYYVAHPLVPLAETEVINLDMVGGIGTDTIQVGQGNNESQVLASRIDQIAEDLGLQVERVPLDGSDHVSFANTGNRAVMIHQGEKYLHQQKDDLGNIVPDNIRKAGVLLGGLIKRDVYGETRPDYLTTGERSGISLFLLLLLAAYCIEIWWVNYPEFRLAGISAEALYFSSTYRIGRSLLLVTVPAAILLLLITISQLPRDLNLIVFNGHWDTNFSGYLTLKKTSLYLREIFQNGFGSTVKGGAVAEILSQAFRNSFMLLGAAVALALPLGVLKGLFDAWSSRRENELRSFSSVLLLSVPDILWILLAFSFMILAGNSEILAQFLPVTYLRGWLLPLATLTVMPAVYISRIAFVGFRHELNKPYITALKAKGASRARIFFSHLLQPVWERSLSAMQGLIAILISNLIIVEYLFDYKGLANYILQADKAQDNHTFVSLILGLTVLYVLMVLACSTLRKAAAVHRKGGSQ